MKIGFLGMGIMGKAMATRLVQAGFELLVWNRTSACCEELVAQGARATQSPAQVVRACPVTITMVSDPAASREVFFGEDGALEGLSEGRGYVDMSTIDGETAREIQQAVTGQGGLFLEAPVSGSKKPAEEGKLLILAAGDRSLYEVMQPAFEVLGQQSYFLGEVGQGAAMKLVVNMMMGGMMSAFAEGLALAQQAGLQPQQLLEVLDQGAVANPMFRLKGPSMLEGNYSVAFPLKHMQKDLRLALALGEQLAQPLPSTSAANESFKRARAQGLGDDDFSALLQTLLPSK